MDINSRVCLANKRLFEQRLVVETWGNVSELDRESGRFTIKPSGVPFSELTGGGMVTIDIEGNIVGGSLKPSSDWRTHLELYRAFFKYTEINAICHTHSCYAVVFAQAGMEIPVLGTTHADHFLGAVPVTRELSAGEIAEGYESWTGRVIAERFAELNPAEIPAALVRSHGPFCFGKDADGAVSNAVALEEVARMALHTLALNPGANMSRALLAKHFERKHGENAYYGQN